jgi:hypothetical protein
LRPLIASRNAGLTDFVLHLDKHLSAIIAKHGKATYAILFAIVFAETGFVLTPFLPGKNVLSKELFVIPKLCSPK